MKDITSPPYNGLFYCSVRRQFNRWEDHIRFYKERNL